MKRGIHCVSDGSASPVASSQATSGGFSSGGSSGGFSSGGSSDIAALMPEGEIFLVLFGIILKSIDFSPNFVGIFHSQGKK